MRLTVHMTEGRQYAFTISEEQAGADFIDRVRFWEVFDRPILRINDGRGSWALNPALIEEIRFETGKEPPWSPPDNILSSKCISAESYRRKLARLEAGAPAGAGQFQAGKCIEAALEVTFAGGTREFFECYLMLRPRGEQALNQYRLFDKLTYPIPCEGGGFVLLNTRRIECIRIHPSPPEDPESAWLVDGFVENASE
ncbi:MAG: hypothetical protein ABFD69_06165 [Candidatus Sumerlaeia bacterium]